MEPITLFALGLAGLIAIRKKTATATADLGGATVSFTLTGRGAPYADSILGNAIAYGLDPYLVAAICQHESSWNPNALNQSSVEKSIGLMQINIYAHPEYDPTDLLDPATNIAAGSSILAESLSYALAKVPTQDATRIGVEGYNLGEGKAVAAYLAGRDGDPAYAQAIANAYQSLTGQLPW
jgi:soluble lytic murein transglycosylase-like protein